MPAVLTLVACATVQAAAQDEAPSARSATPAPSEWARGSRLLLGVTQPALGFAAQWRFERSSTGDVLVERQESRGARLDAGVLLLLAGHGALLVRDAQLAPGRELDAVNGPLMMLELVLRLLERAVPGGPTTLVRDRHIDLSERRLPIGVSGVGAEGEFLAPWRLSGTIGPAGQGQVKFELEFASTARAPAGARYETNIAGVWQNTPPPVVFPDSLPLRGWQVYQIRPMVHARGATNVVGLGTSAPMGFVNLAEVRRRVAQWNDERARRARWQCSG